MTGPIQRAARPGTTGDDRAFGPVALILIGVGITLRLAGLALFLRVLPEPTLVRQCLVGLALHLTAGAVLHRGHPEWAILVSGLDFGLIASATPRFGTASELHLYGLILPFLVLTFSRWSLRVRIFLALLPLAVFAALRLGTDVPVSTGWLPPDRLRDLATVNVLVVVGLCLAVTGRAVQLANRSRQRAEGLAEARSRLIDDMSHELRTPVTIVLTAAQTALARERSGDSYRRTLGVIERQARGLGRMMRRMLEMSRAERAELAVSPTDDLAASVRRTVEGFRELAAARSVSLTLVAEDVAATTDGALLQVVLDNLLSNAVRFSPDGAEVEVRLAADGPRPMISVRDQGPGIARQDLPHVFERYWRADKARSRGQGHHGLGLAIARRYARLLGARLEVDSELGRGAMFTVRW